MTIRTNNIALFNFLVQSFLRNAAFTNHPTNVKAFLRRITMIEVHLTWLIPSTTISTWFSLYTIQKKPKVSGNSYSSTLLRAPLSVCIEFVVRNF
jgi:hypothetical protein